MNVSVRFFASLTDITGRSSCTVHVPAGADVRAVVAQLVARYPALEGHQDGWHYAVNQTLATPDTILKPGDRVAIFPYIAGG